MAAEQLMLNLGHVGWAAMPQSTSDGATTGSHFRGFCGQAGAHETSRVYEAADRAWEQSPMAAQRPPVLINGTATLSPEVLADHVRMRLEIDGSEGVPSMVLVLRQLGCVLAPMPVHSPTISSFSCWFDEAPLALLRTTGLGRRRVRFDAAHELGHLLMHKGRPAGSNAEDEANAFAGCFLIPRTAFMDVDLKPFSWDAIRAVADACNVTMLAVLKQAHERELISSAVYRAAMVDASRRKWRTVDPYDHEHPESLELSA